jgi:4-amino-4-deoxy-L-arabinose transferase-like glycosyltransferase
MSVGVSQKKPRFSKARPSVPSRISVVGQHESAPSNQCDPAQKNRFASLCPLLVLLAIFVAIECFLPLATTVQTGSDEGFELAKATLCLHGHHLYTEIWNDQPPLHTFLVTQVLKHVSGSILGPRLLTVAFSVILLISVFLIVQRLHGTPTAAIATGLLLASPGFLELSNSCMLEIPSLSTAVAALALLLLPKAGKWQLWTAASGLIFGLALQMKLVPAILLSLAVLIFWLKDCDGRLAPRKFLVPFIVFSVSLMAAYIVSDLVMERGAYLAHFSQSWHSHFGAAKTDEYGGARFYPFDVSVLFKNWDTTVPALVGVILLLRTWRIHLWALVPLTWLVVTFVVFTIHRPWWAYYYLHTAIPLCWCAAIALTWAVTRAMRSKRVAGLIALGAFCVCAVCWMGGRMYLQVMAVRSSPQVYSEPVLEYIARLKPYAHWMYATKEIYSFHAGIPMPPELAVVPLKRFWAGEITNDEIVADLASIRPEIMLLNNDGQQAPFQTLLDRDYRLVFEDREHRLYAYKTIAKRIIE